MGLIGKNNEVSAGTKIEDYERSRYLTQENVDRRGSDQQTNRFSRALNGVVADNFVVTSPIVLTAISVALSAGSSFQCDINGDIVGNGSSLTATNFIIPLPDWFVDVDEELNTSLNGGGIVWIGYYAD